MDRKAALHPLLLTGKLTGNLPGPSNSCYKRSTSKDVQGQCIILLCASRRGEKAPKCPSCDFLSEKQVADAIPIFWMGTPRPTTYPPPLQCPHPGGKGAKMFLSQFSICVYTYCSHQNKCNRVMVQKMSHGMLMHACPARHPQEACKPTN
eukprot:1155114-Pelagomonas_calceolata.AAC.2